MSSYKAGRSVPLAGAICFAAALHRLFIAGSFADTGLKGFRAGGGLLLALFTTAIGFLALIKAFLIRLRVL
ncbi:MAG: hypothetical protein CVV45_03990 [Spirochaetae bacterium HGW-Spirochaetae-10]|nr:MAG: hypothetical protein CVV45_03990 [Spirochaetae bacterium HGW-Spirochaetae-10]